VIVVIDITERPRWSCDTVQGRQCIKRLTLDIYGSSHFTSAVSIDHPLLEKKVEVW